MKNNFNDKLFLLIPFVTSSYSAENATTFQSLFRNVYVSYLPLPNISQLISNNLYDIDVGLPAVNSLVAHHMLMLRRTSSVYL